MWFLDHIRSSWSWCDKSHSIPFLSDFLDKIYNICNVVKDYINPLRWWNGDVVDSTSSASSWSSGITITLSSSPRNIPLLPSPLDPELGLPDNTFPLENPFI